MNKHELKGTEEQVKRWDWENNWQGIQRADPDRSYEVTASDLLLELNGWCAQQVCLVRKRCLTRRIRWRMLRTY